MTLLGPDGQPIGGAITLAPTQPAEVIPCSRCGAPLTMDRDDAKVARKFHAMVLCGPCRDAENPPVALNAYRVTIVIERRKPGSEEWEELAGFTAEDEALTLRATLHADGGLSDRLRDRWLRLAESADLAEAVAADDL